MTQAPYLKMYKDYSNNFETASETCQQLREHSAVAAALDVHSKITCYTTERLTSILIKFRV